MTGSVESLARLGLHAVVKDGQHAFRWRYAGVSGVDNRRDPIAISLPGTLTTDAPGVSYQCFRRM